MAAARLLQAIGIVRFALQIIRRYAGRCVRQHGHRHLTFENHQRGLRNGEDDCHERACLQGQPEAAAGGSPFPDQPGERAAEQQQKRPRMFETHRRLPPCIATALRRKSVGPQMDQPQRARGSGHRASTPPADRARPTMPARARHRAPPRPPERTQECPSGHWPAASIWNRKARGSVSEYMYSRSPAATRTAPGAPAKKSIALSCTVKGSGLAVFARHLHVRLPCRGGRNPSRASPSRRCRR